MEKMIVSRRVKTVFAAFVIIIAVVFVFMAASGSVFFGTAKAFYDDTIEDSGARIEGMSFYKYWSSYDNEYKRRLATLYLDEENITDDLVHVTINIFPQEKYRLDSFNLEIGIILPVSAVILDNPQDGTPPAFDYERTDRNAYVDLDFSGMEFRDGKAASVDFWLDLSEVEPNIRQGTNINVSFSLHELSVFKILKYEADMVIELDLP